jgi:DNA-binding transcriptional LysR family regulator
MPAARISLAQWQTVLAVVDHGGYAQAAEALNKGQSTVSYAVGRLESLLDVKVFRLEGRRAVLTEAGQLLYRRARLLVEEAGELEKAARNVAAGWEAEIRLAVDQIFPMDTLFDSLARFSDEQPHTRIELRESVLSGASEALLQGEADLAISGKLPQGFLADPLLNLRFIAVAHPEHALHRLGRTLEFEDLQRHRQIVVRDSGSLRATDSGWLGAEQRWTVSQMSTSIRAIAAGNGFAWLPELKIADLLAAGKLKPLPLREGRERSAQLFLIYADREYAGPGVKRLGELLRQTVARDCARHE